jgi:hypothetical protein
MEHPPQGVKHAAAGPRIPAMSTTNRTIRRVLAALAS